MKRNAGKEVTAIVCCTYCAARNIFRPFSDGIRDCQVCGKKLEFRLEVTCPHCHAASIRLEKGRGPDGSPFLVCSYCARAIADGIPLAPDRPVLSIRLRRALGAALARAIGRLFQAQPRYRYEPRKAREGFQDLLRSWTLECGTREAERRGEPRPRENNFTVYARPEERKQMRRSRQVVLARHQQLLGKYQHHFDTFLRVAATKIYRDEYGDEIWKNAEKEIDRLIDDKLFKNEGIRDRKEFYSFEFLCRCEPAFSGEYADCWLFDELKDRVAAYHQIRMSRLNDPEADIDALAGVDFEEWIIRSIKQAGISDVLPTPRIGDQGADVIVRSGGRAIVIQAKRYDGNVGNDAVQQAYTAKTHYGAHEAWVVTNSMFTPKAREVATSTGVRLIDRSDVRDIGLLIAAAFASTGTERLVSARHAGGTVTPVSTADDSTFAYQRRHGSTTQPHSVSVDPPYIEQQFSAPLTAQSGPPPPIALHGVQPPPVPDPERSRRGWSKRSRLVAAGAAAVMLVAFGTYYVRPHDFKAENESAIRAVLDNYAAAVRTRDVERVAECYASRLDSFYLLRDVPRERALQEIARAWFTKYDSVAKLSITNVRFKDLTKQRASVEFDKEWDFRGVKDYSGSERQEMGFVKEAGQWRIASEIELRVDWVHHSEQRQKGKPSLTATAPNVPTPSKSVWKVLQSQDSYWTFERLDDGLHGEMVMPTERQRVGDFNKIDVSSVDGVFRGTQRVRTTLQSKTCQFDFGIELTSVTADRIDGRLEGYSDWKVDPLTCSFSGERAWTAISWVRQ